jgi:type VI secretion system protein ImpH
VDVFENATRIPLVTVVEYLARLDPAARIRFVEDPRLIFHTSDVTALRERWTEHGRVFDVRTPILGMLGASSPLASFFTEDVLGAHDEERLLAFYDTLHHRLVEIFLEVDRRISPARAVRMDGEDAFSRRACAVVGVRPDTKTSFSRGPMLALGRLFGVRPGTRDALDAALQTALPTYSIDIDDVIPRDIPLIDEQTATLGAHAVLGRSVLGGHILGQTGLIRLSFGRIHDEELEGLLPGGHLHRGVRDVVEQSTVGLADVEIDAEIASGLEPIVRLGDEQTCLGANALLGRAPDASPLHVRISLGAEERVVYGPSE